MFDSHFVEAQRKEKVYLLIKFSRQWAHIKRGVPYSVGVLLCYVCSALLVFTLSVQCNINKTWGLCDARGIDVLYFTFQN